MPRQKLIHAHSNVYQSNQPKAPAKGSLEKGEIAVNYNDTEPAIFIENNSGNIVKFNAVQRSEISQINSDIDNLETSVSTLKDTKVTLNGTQQMLSANTTTFYAPTASGQTNTILASDGSGKSPKWISQENMSVGNASKVNGYNILVVTQMPASPDANTIYILK